MYAYVACMHPCVPVYPVVKKKTNKKNMERLGVGVGE